MRRGDRKIRKSDARRADTGRDTRLRHQMNAARVAVETPEALDAVNDMVTRVDHIFNPPEEEIKDIVNGMIDKIEQEQSAGTRPHDTVDLQEINDLLDQLIEDTEQLQEQTPPSAQVRRGRVGDLISRFEAPELGAFDFLDNLDDEPLEEYDDSVAKGRPMPVQEYVHPKRRAQSSPYLGWQLPSHGPIPQGYGRDSKSSGEEDFGLIQMYEPDRHISKQEERLYPGPRIEEEGSGSDDEFGLEPLFDESGQPEGQYPGPPIYMPLSDFEEYIRSRREEGRRDECVICLESEGECFESCECPRAAGNWYHYECVADRIVRTNDKKCSQCKRLFWDPIHHRISRNYQPYRQTPGQYLREKIKVFGSMAFWTFMIVLLFYLSRNSTKLHFLAGIVLVLEIIVVFVMFLLMFREYHSGERRHHLVITFKDWPEKDVYPNDTRVEDMGIVGQTILPNEEV